MEKESVTGKTRKTEEKREKKRLKKKERTERDYKIIGKRYEKCGK
jgi:hypothetical protein